MQKIGPYFLHLSLLAMYIRTSKVVTGFRVFENCFGDLHKNYFFHSIARNIPMSHINRVQQGLPRFMRLISIVQKSLQKIIFVQIANSGIENTLKPVTTFYISLCSLYRKKSLVFSAITA